MKRIAILQSNYIPWKGYFDMIAAVDEFILYDDMQFTKNDWRNRNQIKTPQGVQWLTVPVKVKGKFGQAIRETAIDGKGWATSHWKSFQLYYRRAQYFNEIASLLEPVYSDPPHIYISQLNRQLIEIICDYIGIHATISCSSDYTLMEGKTGRLVDLCIQAGGTEYISGPAAKDYLDENLFRDAGIKLTWFNYDNYPAYPQLWGEFVHGVSILDLLFNCGKESPRYMKHVLKDLV